MIGGFFMGVGGIGAGQGPVSQFVMISKQSAEQAITSNIREALQNPEKTIQEIQQPSPLSQFLDIKI